eukprot:Gb_32900 [translate_table: standard]
MDIGDEEPKEIDEAMKQTLLKGLPIGPLKVQPPSTTIAAMVGPPTLRTTLSFDSSVAGSSTLGPVPQQLFQGSTLSSPPIITGASVPPSVAVSPIFKVPHSVVESLGKLQDDDTWQEIVTSSLAMIENFRVKLVKGVVSPEIMRCCRVP